MASSETAVPPARPVDRDDFHIAIICALPLEADMAESVFDSFYETRYGKITGDPNTYTTGIIAGYNVVLAYMPSTGTLSAATVAAFLKSSYRQIHIAFVAGICGVVPFNPRGEEIILGDCIISTAIVQYDFGRQHAHGFTRKNEIEDTLGRASLEIRSFTAKLQTYRSRQELEKRLAFHLRAIQGVKSGAAYPGIRQDLLFESTFIHGHEHESEVCDVALDNSQICTQDCASIGCMDRGKLIPRHRLENESTSSSGDQNISPVIHFGRFGSANTLMRSGLDRDHIADSERVLAFEMEGAGVWDSLPTIVVKAASDYADSHKNKAFQAYAAAVAAAAVKATIERIELSEDILGQGSNSSRGPFYTIPNVPNPRFTGRATDLQDLHHRYLNNQGYRSLAIYGLGGMGKSQLVLAFGFAVKAQYPDVSVYWVSMINAAQFKRDLSRIAQACSLSDGKDDSFAIVTKYLSSPKSGKWLLLVDNADDKTMLFAEDLLESLPQSEIGFTIFTTRYKDVAADVANGNIMHLQEMPLQEAKKLLTRLLEFATPQIDDTMAEELLKELVCLPLAIAQAASYILKTSITIPKYLQLMRHNDEEAMSLLASGLLSSKPNDSTDQKNAHNAVALTWLISFRTIRQDEPNAASILFFVACIENTRIPLYILPQPESQVRLNDAIGTLRGYSFLTKHGDEESYDMHRLVHLAVKNWISNDKDFNAIQTRAVSHLADLITAEFQGYDYRWPAYLRQYCLSTCGTDHSLRALRDSKTMMTNERAELCLRVGQCLLIDSQTSEAMALTREACSWRDRMLPENSYHRLSAQNLLLFSYDYLFLQDELNQVQILQPDGLAEGSPEWFMVQDNLQIVHSSNFRFEECIKILEKECAVKSKTNPDDTNYEYLELRKKLAGAYQASEEFTKAEQIMESILEILSKTLPEDSSELLACQKALATIYRDNKCPQKAIAMLEKTLKVLDKDGWDKTSLMETLAQTYVAVGMADEAEAIRQQWLAISERLAVMGHPDLIFQELSLILKYNENHQYREALSLLSRVTATGKDVIWRHDKQQAIFVENMNLLNRSAVVWLERAQTLEEAIQANLVQDSEVNQTLEMAQQSNYGDSELGEQLDEPSCCCCPSQSVSEVNSNDQGTEESESNVWTCCCWQPDTVPGGVPDVEIPMDTEGCCCCCDHEYISGSFPKDRRKHACLCRCRYESGEQDQELDSEDTSQIARPPTQEIPSEMTGRLPQTEGDKTDDHSTLRTKFTALFA